MVNYEWPRGSQVVERRITTKDELTQAVARCNAEWASNEHRMSAKAIPNQERPYADAPTRRDVHIRIVQRRSRSQPKDTIDCPLDYWSSPPTTRQIKLQTAGMQIAACLLKASSALAKDGGIWRIRHDRLLLRFDWPTIVISQANKIPPRKCDCGQQAVRYTVWRRPGLGYFGNVESVQPRQLESC